MNCMLLRRKTDNAVVLNLKTLFSTATVSPVSGTSGGSNNGTWENNAVAGRFFQDTALQGKNAYAFVLCNGYIGIWKIQNRAVVTTPILQSDSGKCGLAAFSSSGIFYYYNGGYTTVSSAGGSYLYGGTIVVVVFSDDYASPEIDNILSNATVTRLAYRDSSSAGTVRTNDKTKTVYLTACNNTMDAWVVNNNTYENIYQSYTPSGPYGPQPSACVDGNYLRSGSTTSATVYSSSIIGLS